jgi:uncharacterized protein (TIGR00255 family)
MDFGSRMSGSGVADCLGGGSGYIPPRCDHKGAGVAVSSMTGFARAEGRHGTWAWAWELKSVNGKGLDLRCRLPPGLDALEGPARERLMQRFKRGSFTINLQMQRGGGADRLIVNEAALGEVLALHKRLAGQVDAAPPRLEALLAVRGIAEAVEAPESEASRAEREAAILASLDGAVQRLAQARAGEGRRLADVLTALLAEIGRLAAAARSSAGAQPERLRARFAEQLAQILAQRPGVSEDRLAQEIAILATRGDVREELDRLGAHGEAAAEAIAAGGGIGRKLEFLAQEFNREANTLCSKSTDTELTRIGLDLKAAIDQFREQAANIE